jgi:hypothetical protein
MNRFAAVIAAAAEQVPMSNGEVQTIPGRLLLVDGDGLCYYCAGNDDTLAGQARINLIQKIESAARSSGAERVRVLLTGRGSHKGYRYAVGAVKPYQGQREGSRRPKNWQFLRDTLESWPAGHPLIDVEITDDVEADDLFSRYALKHENCVINTQDKDMRMIPGWHLDWITNLLVYVADGTWELVRNEKVYGRKWFWLQMLHGDTADHIPGLEWYTDGSLNKSGPDKGKLKVIRCGEKSSAVYGLDKYTSDMGACLYLQGLYRTCYGDRWLVHMLEQAVLLWMRNDPAGHVLNVADQGNPLHPLTTHELWPAARDEIMARVAQSQLHEETQDDGSGIDPISHAGEAEQQVCVVPATVQPSASCAGSLSLNGEGASDTAQVVQCTAGQGREQLPPVRSQLPASVPVWLRSVLAKA